MWEKIKWFLVDLLDLGIITFKLFSYVIILAVISIYFLKNLRGNSSNIHTTSVGGWQDLSGDY